MANQTNLFAVAAPGMLAHGLAPLPLGGNSGKQPLISGFNRWRKPPTADTVKRHADRFPDANLGLVCGASNLVVVDIDRPDQADRVEELLGCSPLVVETPSGGSHRYFLNPEAIGCLNLRSGGLDVDIKGQGGIVACPPSVSLNTGKAYRFLEGDWGRLPDLPVLSRSRVESISRRHPTDGHRHALNPLGTRNNRLFDHLRALSPWASLDEILGEAQRYNLTQNEEPEPEHNVVATARQVWRYQQRGALRTPAGFIKIDAADLDALKAVAGRDYPVALALKMELERQHGARSQRGETFAVAPTAMAQALVVPGVKDRRRIERARLILKQAGMIEEVEPSGRSRNGRVHTAKFTLRRRRPIHPQCKGHPSPLD